MPTISGVFTSGVLGGVVAAGLNTLWDNGRPVFFAPSTVVAGISVSIGVITSGQPSSEPYVSRTGVRCGAFSDDYYYRIYLQPTRIEFGNLVVPTTRTVEV